MTGIKQSVHDQFAKAAAQYRISQVHAQGEDLQQIAALVQRYDAPYVLDAGCGAGHVSRTVAPFSRAVVALDLTEAMLAQVAQLMAEQQITNVCIQRGDVEQLPFDDATFDLVVSRYSAHHWPRPRVAVRECLRVLKPNGCLLLSDVIAPEEPAFDTFLQAVELLRDQSHVRDHSIAQWQALFAEAGAASRVAFAWDIAIDFDDWVQRMATPAERVAVIRSLFDTAAPDIRQSLQIREDYSFAFRGALFEARQEPAGASD